MSPWQGPRFALRLLMISTAFSCAAAESEHQLELEAELDRFDEEARTASSAEEALDAYRSLERVAIEADRTWTIIAARIGQGGAFLRLGALDSAEAKLRQAADDADDVGHDFNGAVAYDGLATVFERRGQADSAIAALRRAESRIRYGEAVHLRARIRNRLAVMEGAESRLP